jgi:hypothetical protein
LPNSKKAKFYPHCLGHWWAVHKRCV